MGDLPPQRVYLGVDVGTGSARAGVFDAAGRMLGSGTGEIRTWRPRADFVGQSSADIWRAVAAAVGDARGQAGVEEVRGIGFDATCSLVALDSDACPVTVDPDGDDERDVIVWMDHRAIPQAERIDAGGHEVLRYVGGSISPEMQTPKLLWLKENLPASRGSVSAPATSRRPCRGCSSASKACAGSGARRASPAPCWSSPSRSSAATRPRPSSSGCAPAPSRSRCSWKSAERGSWASRPWRPWPPQPARLAYEAVRSWTGGSARARLDDQHSH